MKLADQKVLVVGTGISGIGAVELLSEMGAEPILFDSNDKLSETEIRSRLQEGTRQTPILLGFVPEEIEQTITMLVLSPGVPTDTEFVNSYRNRGVKIWGEIELGYAAAKGKLVAITGTNGKTTTTTLVGEIMKAFYDSVFVVGNIGDPYTLEAAKTGENSVTVAEISSFQLETTEFFHPNVSAILNITPDHLNRHHTMENYIAVKESITKNQSRTDTCVLNYENEFTRNFGEDCPAKVVYFSSLRKLENGFYLEGDTIFRAENGNVTPVMDIHKDMNLVGLCNVENVMAAIAISLAMQVPMDIILQTIRTFHAVEHRIEFTATKRGVDYYNDSKGTNPDAAIQGIRAMTKPTILIGGGYDKQSEYDEWIESFDGKVKLLVLIGQTKEKIALCAKKHGFHSIVMAETFDECLDICVENARPGDAVLLSPACASWGMFPNYEERGRLFKEYVRGLKE
ncbi:MAG: UDP-N-acetylmuramoyl-L-alanine--D-glutamate ligase [Lachnospiraceae bacterium]|nr:UDP-N-acetylmuramoyl-L-alanine--D-glutamate ligase [Lachnospiraceae bacterium]